MIQFFSLLLRKSLFQIESSASLNLHFDTLPTLQKKVLKVPEKQEESPGKKVLFRLSGRAF